MLKDNETIEDYSETIEISEDGNVKLISWTTERKPSHLL